MSIVRFSVVALSAVLVSFTLAQFAAYTISGVMPLGLPVFLASFRVGVLLAIICYFRHRTELIRIDIRRATLRGDLNELRKIVRH